MVLRTYHECDRCGKQCELAPFNFWVNRRTDASGSMENIYENLDLCNACSHGILWQWIDQIKSSEARTIWAFFREKLKPINSRTEPVG